MTPPPRRPGWQLVQMALEGVPAAQLPAPLAYLEQRAKQASYLEAVRAIRECRERIFQ
jgi:hypothetical protein